MSTERRPAAAIATSALIGAALGFVVGVGIARRGPQLPSLDAKVRGEPAAAEARSVEPAVLPAVSVRESSLAVAREEVADALASSPRGSDELTALHRRIADLEAELARLEQLLREGDRPRRELEEFFAVNDLRHEELWRDLFGLLLDAEAVVADPQRHVFPLLLRLVDETGVAAASSEGHTWTVLPEPTSPESFVLMTRAEAEEESDDGSSSWHETQVHVETVVNIPHLPPGWLGGTQDLELRASVERGVNGSLEFALGVEARHSLAMRIEWLPDLCRLYREPWRGGEEEIELPADALPELRAAVERLYDQLEYRAR